MIPEVKTNPAPTSETVFDITNHDFGKQIIINGLKKSVILFLLRLNIFYLIMRYIKNPLKWKRISDKLDSNRRQIRGEKRLKKMAGLNGKYFIDLYIPGWPSVAFNDFIKSEINRIESIGSKSNRFSSIFLAFTKKCPLKCEHCFEWDALNGKTTLTVDDAKEIVKRFQDKGTSQIILTGGEPLISINEIVDILNTSAKRSEVWVLTSGYNLTFENAQKLSAAGLTGVVISLDHFDEQQHNQFRGFKRSYEWVMKGIANAKANGLMVGLSVCVTKEFCTEANLFRYAELAKTAGVGFIQLLEPKAVGHYKAMDVKLDAAHFKVLDDFMMEINYGKTYRDHPLVVYHGYYQRRAGCFSAGSRNLYIDTDGDLHACPFCQIKRGNALAPNLDELIDNLQFHGCHSFKLTDF